MSEKKLYQKFKKEWLKYKNSYVSRVETKFEDGRPDLHIANQFHVDFFIELKFMNKKFRNKKLTIRNSQFVWFYKYTGKIESFFLFEIENEFYVLSRNKLKEKLKEFSSPINFSFFEKNTEKFKTLKDLIKKYQNIK